MQADGAAAPTYRLVSSEGPHHARVFVVVVALIGRISVEGRGPSKPTAEQDAARAALSELDRGARVGPK